MFIDASALTALMMVEDDALELFAKVERAKTSPRRLPSGKLPWPYRG
ncbi:hypothetical protein [Arvimicrobium flavum]